MPRHPLTSTNLASRRAILRGTIGLAATLSLPAGPAQAQGIRTQQAAPRLDVITRNIPRTKEALPAIGLGTFLTFDTIPGQKRDHLREVLRRYWDAGVRVVDTSPLYGTAEITVGDYATSLNVSDGLFVANKIWATGDYLADESHARRSLALSEGRLWRTPIDLMQCHSLVNVDVIVPYLRAWKKEGRIRYSGITHFEAPYLEPLTQWVERGDIDFVQVNYSIFNRAAEARLLPMAAERGIAVLTNMPFEKARLFKIVEKQPLPGFAKEFGADNWAQFFLKWVISNPAVTCALPATSDPDHAAENIGALRGPLPDREMRARMVNHMEGIAGFDQIAKMPWYPDKKYPGIIGRSQAELRSRL
jgi:diketogulonate reductase-like aldo/keto reductase